MSPTSTRAPLNLNRLVYFAAVVEAGSFTRAAQSLGVTKAVVSQHVSRLEEQVGVTLLLRTTRKVVPTEAGRALHARCQVILGESAEALDELTERTAEPRGTLRVTAPLDYGVAVVAKVVTRFTRAHPGCDVELILTDRLVDIQTVDLAIRVGWLRDSGHLVRRIGTLEQCLVVSHHLATQLDSEEDPECLHLFPFISNASLPEPQVLRLTHQTRGRRKVRVTARIFADTTPAVHALVLAGAGLAVLPDYLVAADLAAGRLVRILPEWGLRRGGIHTLLPLARFRPAKVTRFLELMTHAEAERSRG
jgi:DNA-binding transcriptional LysR family regulator